MSWWTACTIEWTHTQCPAQWISNNNSSYQYLHSVMFIKYSYVHTYVCTYTHTYIHTCMHTYIHTCIHTYIYTYIHLQYACMHVCYACMPWVHISIHTYTHTYIYMYACIPKIAYNVLFTWSFFSSVPSWRKILYHDDVTWSITTCISKLAKFVNWLQSSNLYSIIICNSENLYTHVCMHSCKHTHTCIHTVQELL